MRGDGVGIGNRLAFIEKNPLELDADWAENIEFPSLYHLKCPGI
jgi:hypothetical protein